MSYAAMPRSINRDGGAQFTYQFWLLMTNADDAGYKDILVRGDVTPYNLMAVDTVNNVVILQVEDIIIKCPCIRFDGAYNRLAVEINTVLNPNPEPLRIGPSPANSAGALAPGESDASHSNVLELGLNRWVLYTFVFQDSTDISDFERGIEMRFHVNDFLYQSTTMQGTLRQNNGNLHLFPSGAIQGCRIGNLTYYNYALQQDEITRVYGAGPPTQQTTKTKHGSSLTPTPLFLTEYNKLNIYNS